jgi:hypothetical protein
MRNRARPTRGHPLLVCRKRRLYLSFFQDLSRGTALQGPKPPQVEEWHDSGGLPAQVNHLVWLVRALGVGRLRGHGTTVPVSAIA